MSHPYRQKAPHGPADTPYPVDVELQDPHVVQDPNTAVQPLPSQYIEPQFYHDQPVHESQAQITSGPGSVVSGSGSGSGSATSPVEAHPGDTIDSQNPFPTLHNGARTLSSSSAPYPVYEALTPPPVFPAKESIISPPSNPLSTSSSVTNLNLNQHSSLDNKYSKSENNLATPLGAGKYGHNRSVSSTSSFFYDKNDNASMVDFSQNVITQYLGQNSNTLLPRIKTIELYRKNAKKSNDPNVLFQYAQYMLQTALLLDETNTNSSLNPSQLNSVENSPRKAPLPLEKESLNVKNHKKSKSSNSIDLLNSDNIDKIDDRKLKRALLKEATLYLKRLSDKGYVEAQYLLADAYSSGALEKIENREAFQLFQSAAKHGHVESAYRTSYCYEEGLGTGRDARKSVEYLKMAAAKNHPAAMYKLGVYSFYGRMGLSQQTSTKKLGIKWLERASNVATELIAAAPYELGKIYFNGFQDIVIPDKKYALELYSQAAALGHVQSAAILGKFYEVGEIVPQDSNLSIHYYTEAALGGDPESMLAMCAWYLVGNEPYLPKDESEAFEWAKRAAMCNLPKAQFALANFYEKGIGCIKNVNESQTWYKKAAENGDEKSLSRMADKDLASKLEKKLRKKKSNNVLAAANANGVAVPTATSKNAAQDKDCVIM
ncbi:HCP-like protein [Suhomyces tanzawaensis NRRL Y-17324]|uniref:HCP-like protein n=1 Tax=Suhomyces tanzawaensis NRRL Y-17324 TaxID=984487 RepID=A0A1E4SIA7_9ASCO|nr:HCP-like protein [Suhomyces tanzawaensis NRRL Y-17324]ODV79241.1 HCP-like protein [Suhomyces tanzawaensis NRRL Y-17324]